MSLISRCNSSASRRTDFAIELILSLSHRGRCRRRPLRPLMVREFTAGRRRFTDRVAVAVEEADGHRKSVQFDGGEAELARRFGRVERVFVRDERRDGIGAGAADEKPRLGVDQLEMMVVAADVEIDLAAAHQRIERDHAQMLIAREVAVIAGGDDRMMADGDPPRCRLLRCERLAQRIGSVVVAAAAYGVVSSISSSARFESTTYCRAGNCQCGTTVAPICAAGRDLPQKS